MFRGAGMDEDIGQGHTKGGAHVLHNSIVFHFKRIKDCILVIRVAAAPFHYLHTQAGCGEKKDLQQTCGQQPFFFSLFFF